MAVCEVLSAPGYEIPGCARTREKSLESKEGFQMVVKRKERPVS
jgi:hypothetical protein